MAFTEMSCRDFAGALADKVSVPGGGGAAALVAALGAALGSMVGNFTLGKKKYADVEEDIRDLMAAAETLRLQLLDCVEADAAAFEPLSRAYGIPKESPGRQETLERCLRDAAAVPMQILRLSCQAIELQRDFAEKGSVLMISDAGTGAAFCKAALYGAALNVRVNTRLMADRAFAEALDAEAEALTEKYGKLADAVYAGVYGRLS